MALDHPIYIDLRSEARDSFIDKGPPIFLFIGRSKGPVPSPRKDQAREESGTPTFFAIGLGFIGAFDRYGAFVYFKIRP